jgi:tellurite resistance protein TerC
MSSQEVIFFIGFLLFIAAMLTLDLGILSKKNHVVQFKEAGSWTLVWVVSAIGFYFLLHGYANKIHGIANHRDLERIVRLYFSESDIKKFSFLEENFAFELKMYASNVATEFLTGWMLEYSLSVDNIFVIILILTSFSVKETLYKKVLLWGILGAVVMRFMFIFLGAYMIQKFHFILYIFGVVLMVSGAKFLLEFFKGESEDSIDPSNHLVTKLINRFFPTILYPRFVRDFFFVVKGGKIMITPLLLVVIVIEFSDLIFAIDSVPAVFAVTKDPNIVFFSNIFAIMGLRSMFFFLSNIMHYFRFLKAGLAFILMFIGLKMLSESWWDKMGFEKQHSIYVILSMVGLSILFSIIVREKKEVHV